MHPNSDQVETSANYLSSIDGTDIGKTCFCLKVFNCNFDLFFGLKAIENMTWFNGNMDHNLRQKCWNKMIFHEFFLFENVLTNMVILPV